VESAFIENMAFSAGTTKLVLLPKSESVEEIKNLIGNPIQLASCANCNIAVQSLCKCKQCGVVKYCSRLCQRAHWEKHKELCCYMKTVRSYDKKNFSLANKSIKDWKPYFIDDFSEQFHKVCHNFLSSNIFLTLLQFCQQSAELAVLNLFVHYNIYLKTIYSAALSIIKMKCEYKKSLLTDVKDRLQEYQKQSHTIGLQIFALENDLESIKKKLGKSVKSTQRERLLLEQANLKNALECKQQMMYDAKVVVDTIQLQLPEMEKLYAENRWTLALNSTQAQYVD